MKQAKKPGSYKFAILLSASVPSDKRAEKYTKIKNAQIQIEEAVIGLARNILEANGKLILGGHPTINELLATVAMEYEAKNLVEPPIKIYQSRAYEAIIPKVTTELLIKGYSEIVWTEAKGGEKADPSVTNQPQCTQSLEHMRTLMVNEEIDAMVCIGGMEGVEAELALFRKYQTDKPVYLFKTTGGASAILAEELADEKNIRTDEQIAPANREELTAIPESDFKIIPYTYITSVIINEILNKKKPS